MICNLYFFLEKSITMSLQSSTTDFVASLQLVQKKLYQIAGPILIGIGTISCILSLIVFTKKNLRKNPCSIYFIASHVSNLLLIYISTLLATLSAGYDITPTSYSLSFCRFTFYMQILLDALCPSYLILASIDRVLVTSSNTRTRRYSTHSLAYISITGVALFWGLFHSPVFVLVNILELAPNYFLCYFQSAVYIQFIAYYSLIIKPIILPATMAILGVWCMKNIRGARRARVILDFVPPGTRVEHSLYSAQSKDRQLIRILLVDTSIYFIFILMPSVVTMYQQVTQNEPKSFNETQLTVFLIYVSAFSGYIPFCIGFYTNLFVSKTFRNELKNTLLCK